MKCPRPLYLDEGGSQLNCPRCGDKVGFLEKVTACPTCGSQLCGRCAAWEGCESSAASAEQGSEEEVQMKLCSEDCAYSQYARFIQAIDPATPLVLNDDGHVGFTVSVAEADDGTPPSYISFALKMLDPRAYAKAASVAPEVRPLYDRVKRDLTEGRRDFREGY